MDKFQQSQFIFGIVVSILAKSTSNNEEETDERGKKEQKQYGSVSYTHSFFTKKISRKGLNGEIIAPTYILIVPCVTAVDDLVSTVFDKRTLEFGTRKTLSDNLVFQGLSFNHGNPFVIRGQTSLPLLVSD
jgi:hypothetical protein